MKSTEFFLKTERLGFSRWEPTDMEPARTLWGNPQVTKYICATGFFSDEYIANRLKTEIRNDELYHVQYWPVFELETGAFIGCCGLRPYRPEEYEIGFHLRPEFWGKGYAKEAAEAVIHYAFTVLKGKKLFAGHNPSNTASRKVLGKLGFSYVRDEYYEPTGLFHPSYELEPQEREREGERKVYTMERPRGILLFDLDGTLLKDDKTLSQYTLEVVSKCKEQGSLIGISTSRSEQNCLKFLKELKPDILISSGGALVRVEGKTICASSFSAEETKRFIATARNVCGVDCEITVDTLDAHYWNYKINPKEQDKSWGDSIYTDFSDFNHEALKICVEISDPSMAQKLSELFSELDSQRFSDGDWYKFTKSGITKEKAILAVCEACHVDVSEIVAFGDDYADIGMLKLCGIGVAMGNAIQEVKDIANAITISNEEDGVAVYLEKWRKSYGIMEM